MQKIWSKDMVVKGYFSQPKIFKIIFSFLGQKIAFKNMYHILEDFSKFYWPFKSTVLGDAVFCSVVSKMVSEHDRRAEFLRSSLMLPHLQKFVEST